MAGYPSHWHSISLPVFDLRSDLRRIPARNRWREDKEQEAEEMAGLRLAPACWNRRRWWLEYDLVSLELAEIAAAKSELTVSEPFRR